MSPIQCRHFLTAAEQIHAEQAVAHAEARLRTAASRAYYAAFHSLCDVVRAQSNGKYTGLQNHKGISSALKASNHGGVSEVGTKLDSLRRLRETSDYRLTRGIDPSQVALALLTCDQMMGEAAANEAAIYRECKQADKEARENDRPVILRENRGRN